MYKIIIVTVIILLIFVFYVFNNKIFENFADATTPNKPLPTIAEIKAAREAALNAPEPTATPTTPATPATPATPTPATPPTPATTTDTPATPVTPVTPVATPLVVVPKVVSPTLKLDFLSLLLINKPFAMYFAKDYIEETSTLPDIFGRTDKDAKITGTITSQQTIGNGATGNIYSISGSKNTKIDFPVNSIPTNFTICSITRYTNTNNKRILISTTDNNWAHGHKDGKRGVVYYNEYKTANVDITGNLTDWVATCAKNEGDIPNNVYINNIPSGIKSGGQGGLKLSINNNPTLIDESSDFSLSYIIIWDSVLNDDDIKTVADSFNNYLATGEPLLYNIANLSNDDKLKVVSKQLDYLNAKFSANINKNTVGINSQIKDLNDKISTINGTLATGATATAAKPVVDANQPDVQSFLNKMMELENILANTNVKVDTIIDLNAAKKPVQSKICLTSDKMPTPLLKSFTSDLTNINVLSDNDYEQSQLWCLCNDANKNTPDCVAYSKCKINYDIVKKGIDGGKSFTQLDKINTDVYNECINLYTNFPSIPATK
jgi:hypothetical protein